MREGKRPKQAPKSDRFIACIAQRKRGRLLYGKKKGEKNPNPIFQPLKTRKGKYMRKSRVIAGGRQKKREHLPPKQTPPSPIALSEVPTPSLFLKPFFLFFHSLLYSSGGSEFSLVDPCQSEQWVSSFSVVIDWRTETLFSLFSLLFETNCRRRRSEEKRETRGWLFSPFCRWCVFPEEKFFSKRKGNHCKWLQQFGSTGNNEKVF